MTKIINKTCILVDWFTSESFWDYFFHTGHTAEGPLQGDQLRLLKNRPKCGTAHFFIKFKQNLFRRKKEPDNLDHFST
jgi:hypothetical protein